MATNECADMHQPVLPEERSRPLRRNAVFVIKVRLPTNSAVLSGWRPWNTENTTATREPRSLERVRTNKKGIWPKGAEHCPNSSIGTPVELASLKREGAAWVLPFRSPMKLSNILPLFLLSGSALHAQQAQSEALVAVDRSVYENRVEVVRKIPGLAAFGDFVQREDGPSGSGNFVAHTAVAGERRYALQPWNISRAYWNEGAEATLGQFALLGRGPFGQAVQFRSPEGPSDLPVLMVPRSVLHDSPLDVKGPGRSVSMSVWMIHESGNHAIAGIWHEGTDKPPLGIPAVVRERGQRQYGMFAGLGANPNASSAHVSENGISSFGDKYAHHLAVTPGRMLQVKQDATPAELDAGWSVVGFVYDNEKKNVTAYLNGIATEFWVQNPASQNFFKFAERAWRQSRLARIPGLQAGEDPEFPVDQFYGPPEAVPLAETVEFETAERRVVVRTYEYTKVRVVLIKGTAGQYTEAPGAELVALKANPYWFGHDIYTPSSTEGGPFTIGRVIHSNRHATLAAWIGGVAVYERALSPAQMATLAGIGRDGNGLSVIKAREISKAR